jgi:hypothetical protein
MEYATKNKKGEMVKVDSAFAVSLIDSGKKSVDDFLFITNNKAGVEVTVDKNMADKLIASGKKTIEDFPLLKSAPDYGIDELPAVQSDTSDVDYTMISGPSETEREVVSAVFPRSIQAIDRGADFSEQLASGLGDSFSLPGRVASGLAGNIKRLIDGDLTAEEQIKANLADIGEIHGTDKQNVVLRFIEDVIRDPALLPSLATGGAVGALSKAPATIRGLQTGEKVAKAIPYATRMAQGSTAGVVDVAAQDYLNDYAMDEDKVTGVDYALGGTVGAAMPFAADKAKVLGDKIYDYMKSVKHTDIPAKQFDRIKPAEENFGIGRDDIGLNRQSANEFGENELGEYAGDLTGKLLDENRKRVTGNAVLSKQNFPINQPGQKKLDDMTVKDMLDSGPSQAMVSLAEKGESKLAPFLNKAIRGYNKAVVPAANWGIDIANLVNKPIYGAYNLEQKAAEALINKAAIAPGAMLRNNAYRLPTDATIAEQYISDYFGIEGE